MREEGKEQEDRKLTRRERSQRTLARTHSENYSTNLLTTKTHSHTFTAYRQINAYCILPIKLSLAG